MNRLRVAVIGATKFGRYHVREYRNAGCDVRAILGSSEDSAVATAKMLGETYGVCPTPYHNLAALLCSEKLDAVSVCTPPSLHEEQARMCIIGGISVLCEKPFLPGCSTTRQVAEILDCARKEKLVFALNTQFPALLEHVSKESLRHFGFYAEHGGHGAAMLQDYIPHANSLLARLVPNGSAQNIAFQVLSDDRAHVSFDYASGQGAVKVNYRLKHNPARPRALNFTINDSEYRRLISPDYQKQQLVTPSGIIDIEDPLKVSIERFISAVQGKGAPLVSPSEILDNCRLQDAIMKAVLAVDQLNDIADPLSI